MANTTNTRNTCGQCTFRNNGYCIKLRTNVPRIQYACDRFKTEEEYKAELERAENENRRKVEQRMNFLLTGIYIMTTGTMQLLEYFDAQFQDQKVESGWRHQRKKAASDIERCVKRIRDIYQYSFMEDQTNVMTGHGTHDFDVEAWDNHEDDARHWNKLLLHHMESSWQNEAAEAELLRYYESMPHVGIFEERDFRHFTTK